MSRKEPIPTNMVSKIIGIQFSILSPEEILNGSVANITSKETYIGNKPVIGGIFDPRMGILESNLICPTDGLTMMQTPGYFGHIVLATPVFYIQYLNTILKILRCICFKCSKLLISKEKYKYLLKLPAEARWKQTFTLCQKITRCGEDTEDGCGCKQPNKIRKEGLASIFAEWKVLQDVDEENVILKVTPEMIIKLFKRISDDDINFMGFSPIWSRPEWMVCQVMAVSPPAVRPSVKHDASQRSEDDLSHILINIIKTNNTLKEKIANNAPANIIDDWATVLQYHVATQVDNKIPGFASVAQRSGRPLKSIKDRLNGKQGRMRGNLMAKRVDYSARSVITADPNISIRELGIPVKIAKNITKPVKVNAMNKDFLTKLVLNGPDIYPGAKKIDKYTGQSIQLRYVNRENNITVDIGDIVHRHMMDGDPIIFNRQPSLHRMSLMCHIARIMFKGDTFRMNVADTKPYNADFDGDEMNLHMPQEVESDAELLNLAAVPYQIISPGNNSSIIGIYQDSMLGCYLFTRPNIMFNKMTAMNLLMAVNNVNLDLLNKSDLVSSFEILTQILPPMTLKSKNKQFGEGDDGKTSNNIVEIKNGQYLRGQIDKGILASGSKGILQRICNDFGNMACSNFIDNLQSVINNYMVKSSYSVGISDLITDQTTKDKIIYEITKQKDEVKNIIHQTQLGIFENKTGKTNNEEFETRVNNLLNKATTEAGKLGRTNLSKDNKFVVMVNSGSKGSDLNIAQMMACLGQQNVDGKRIPYGFEHRTLPHFTKYDDSPQARGFVENSFINGLSPHELFFHAMGGRIGLIDTAVKSVTWETLIVIIENGRPKYTEIGSWIDNKLDTCPPENVQHFTERQMELLPVDGVYIPTTDEDGFVTWGEVTDITRHDPGTELYEIKTSGGRSVIVTESKSLLIWNHETKKLKEMPTPDIKIGDCVPVTCDLCSPPIIIDYVDMVDYFPKNEYIYGSDFKRALVMMEETMNGRIKMPTNWWDENNGSTFTLPYTKKSSLQRTLTRSELSNIKEGFIYPYNSTRRNILMADKFQLTEENGIFIGLFLAEGNARKNTVTITNSNENITKFVKNWFDKNSINWHERNRINNIGETINTIIGVSSILSKFLTKFVGFDSSNKYVPTESFIAPECFIIGLLNGYLSGNGTVGKNDVEVGSASKRLIEGVSMLCSRLGIFGKMFKKQLKSSNFGTPTYCFSVTDQWGQVFADKITLLEENKNENLNKIKWGTSHRNFEIYNDVVLDPIIEINIIGVENHPKVYDLTIPSTLNFGLANGLQVRDTSSTGYIQRKLVKALEDLMVRYDGTVRSNKDYIVQFSFGEDGIDTMKVETQDIGLVSMSIQDIYAHYNLPEENLKSKAVSSVFTQSAYSALKKEITKTNLKCDEYTKMSIEWRKLLMNNVFKNKDERAVRYPVAFSYIIGNVMGQQHINVQSLVDITILEAFQMLEDNYKLLDSLYYNKPTDLFKCLYYFYLSPKDLLINKRFNRNALMVLLQTINLSYKRSLVAPGEMVGVVAAQSMGEITTQLTLNSVTYETEILVRNKEGIVKKVQIGDFTEKYIGLLEKAKLDSEIPQKLEYIQDKDTTYAELLDYYEVPSCDEDGNVSWKLIEAVTRHPVINEDGTDTMLKITTSEQREVIATKAKSFLKLIDGKIQGVNGSELKIGDYLPVSKKQLDFKETFELDLHTILPASEYMYLTDIFKNNSMNVASVPEIIPLDYNFGYLIGAYTAEGFMTSHKISIANNDDNYFGPILELCEKWNITTKKYKKENFQENENWTSQDLCIYNTLLCRILENLCGKLSHNKFISDIIVFSNKECLLGFLDAYIGGDGLVDPKSKTIILESVSKNMLIDVQQILTNLNTYSFIIKSKKQETNSRVSLDIKQMYHLYITGSQLHNLASQLNINIQYKQDTLRDILNHNYEYKIHRKDTIIPNEIDGEVVIEKRRAGCCEDILFDKIISIEEVSNTTKYVYDLTVIDTRNFNIYNGLAQKDTFHQAGTAKSNVTRGVPRLEELLSVSANPKNPSLTIYLKSEDETSREKAQAYMYMIEHTKLQDLVKEIEICFDPDDLNTLIEDDRATIAQYKEFEKIFEECAGDESISEEDKNKWIIRMVMDEEVMLDKNITMDDINFTLKTFYNDTINCIYSDYNAGKLIFRIRMNVEMKNQKARQNVSSLDQEDQIYILKNFQDQLMQNVILRGVKGITNVVIRKIKDNMIETVGSFQKQEIWVLDTTGTNMIDIFALDFIDFTRTISNDIIEIQDVLGMEAVRQSLYNEFTDVLEFDGAYINHHHYSLLVDRMTFTEKIVAVFRHGLNNDDTGPIAKASFEETPEQFLKAARHGELDIMKGISACIMVGDQGHYGTSSFQVMLDRNEFIKLDEISEYKVNTEQEELNTLFGVSSDKESYCSIDRLKIDNNVTSIKVEKLGEDDNNYELF